MNILSFITQDGLILVPVLYILGMIIKGIEKIPDKYIPIILLGFGVGLSIFLLGINISGVIQGVLLTGLTVYGNQVLKQMSKSE